ncbi:hypothetical protein F5888DRAFT_1686783 [Russula emetica]|nr:hypothetical protein F5888DRAFT_1686783 [Russula emetica]
MDHTTAQWIHDVSAVTTNTQLAGCSTRSRRHPNDDVDDISMRDLTPEGSESSCPLNEADSSPIDEELGLEADSLELESPGPDDLDEPWPYTFRMGDNVWIRTEGGNWYPGKVSSNNVKQGKTRQKEGLLYPVIFRIGSRIRKYFAPLNGEIKPDTLRTRMLLRRAGWL